jgi:hypothetical protein
MMRFKCPKCGGTEGFVVFGEVAFEVIQDDAGYESSPMPEDPANEELDPWGPDSPMDCGTCDYRGKVADFDQQP